MKAQTAVAQTSADAALLNVRALINTERPWIVVNIEVHEFDPKIYIIRAVNKGRMPAEIFEGHCSCQMQPFAFSPPDDLFDPFIAPSQALTVSGESFEIRRFSPDHIQSGGEMMTQILFVYGRILYWDMFTDRNHATSKPYLTQWCFSYDTSRMSFYRTANGYSRHS